VLFARPLREGEDAETAPPFRPAAPETALSSVTVAGLLTAQVYRFKVVSKVQGLTPFDIIGSNILQAAPSGLPQQPEFVRVLASWSSQVLLSWKPSPLGPRPQRYRVVYARVDAGGIPTEPFGRPVETLGTSTTITGLGAILSGVVGDVMGVGLQFTVYAGSHKEFESAGSRVNVPLISPIGPARAVVVRGASSVPTWGAVAVSLEWLPPPDGQQPLAYRVTVVQTGGGGGTVADGGGGDVFDLADVLHVGARHSLQSGLVGPLVEGQTYSFSVHSKSAQGFYEPFGTTAVVAAPLVVPMNLAVKSCSSKSVTVMWRLPPIAGGIGATGDGGGGAGGGQVQCPQGRVLYRQAGSTVTGSSEVFAIPCALNETLPGYYTIQPLTNNAIYTLTLEARQLILPLSTGGGEVDAYTPWVGTAGLNIVEASPISSAFDLKIVGVTASSALMTWRAGIEGVRARAYKIEYTPQMCAAGAKEGVHQLQHVGGPGTRQQLNVTGLTSGCQYSIIVRAVTPSGVVAPYDGAPAVTTPLATPTDIHVEAVNADMVLFAWLPSLFGGDSWADAHPPALPTDLFIVVERLSDGEKTTFGPFAALSTSAEVGPLTIGVQHSATLLAKASSGDLVIPPSRASVLCLPLPRPAGLRVAFISATAITLAFRTSLPWVSSAYLVRYASSAMLAPNLVSCIHLQSRENAQEEQTCQVTGLSHTVVYHITVASTLHGFSEPVGAALQPVTPIGSARAAGVCYADYGEIALEWLPPVSGPLADAYRIAYTILDETDALVLLGGANTSHLVAWSDDIPHSGSSRETWQRETIKGLVPTTTYHLRVHAISPLTLLLDPLGTAAVIASTRADRGGFLLSLQPPCNADGRCAHIMLGPYTRAIDRQRYQPTSLTMEAWVKLTRQSVVEGEGTRRISILGNLYSVERGLASSQDPTGANSGAVGHFGYGLFCDLQIPSGLWTCTMTVSLEGGGVAPEERGVMRQ